MATKNKKLAYDKQELINAFNSLISNATAQISKDSADVKSKISNLQKNIEKLNASKKQLSLEIYKLIGNKKISEIEKEFAEATELKNFIELQQLKKNELNEKEIERYTYLTKEIRESGKTNQDFINLYKEATKDQSFKSYFNSIEKAHNNIEKAEDIMYEIERIDQLIKSSNTKINDYSKNQKTRKIESIDHLGTFKSFLKNKGFSSSHAEEIYNYLFNNGTLNLNSKSYKIRKRHVTRDRVIKRGGIPAAIVCAGVGATVAPLATQSLIAGSTAYGFLPVFGSMAMTTFATASLGAMAGLIATPVVIKAKNELVKLHYKTWYKNAKTNLREYEKETTLDNLPIANLIDKIEKTKHSILEMSQGKWFTKTLKFVPKHYLNTINRNRIHHLEKYTKDLIAIYAKGNSPKALDLLEQVENFITKDVEESKLFAMLTCNEKGKHIHKTIENIDIFANLKIYLDNVNPTHNETEIKAEEKQAKKSTKNLKHKEYVANQILNGKRLIPYMMEHEKVKDTNEKFEEINKTEFLEEIISPEIDSTSNDTQDTQQDVIILPAAKNNFTPVDRKVISQIYDGDKDILTLTLDNGNKIELNNAKDLELLTVSSAKTVRSDKNKYIISCEDGSILEVAKIKKVKKEVVAALELISDLLKHDDFIEEIQSQGFSLLTINSLKKKISVWELDKTSGFSTSGKVKELYHYCLDTFGDLIDVETNNI